MESLTPELKLPASTISVAMCTYNGEAYLPAQLESIARQTLLPDELVVCDDGSSDRTVAILEEFSQTAGFAVRIHQNTQRLGFAGNFAACMHLCQGDLLVLTDQDDRWSLSRLERTAAAFSADPGLRFTFSDAPLIDPDGHLLGSSIYSNLPVVRADRERLQQGKQMLPVILRWGVVFGCTMAVRGCDRELFLPIPEGWSHDEWISLVLSAVGRSARMAPVTEYRQHAAQLVSGSKWTPLRHLREMRKRGFEQYERELSRYRHGVQAAVGRPELHRALRPALEQKVKFLEARQQIRAGEPGALRKLSALLRTGSYSRLSAGMASACKDLAMMLLKSMA